MDTVTVELGERSYPIMIGKGALTELPRAAARQKPTGGVALVSDSNVAPLYGDRVAKLIEEGGSRVIRCEIPAGEQHKRLAQIEALCGHFLEGGLDRGGLVVALGGGVLGDIAGFAAATYMRGLPYIQIPTTIVAQVDSSVGGKTGVNHPLAKNIIGAFHQPVAVIIEPSFLETLPDREVRAGLAEVIKHGIIADEELFAYMEDHVEAILGRDLEALTFPVRRSCEIKAAVVAEDEREGGRRAILNYGHTFGHGIEAASGYNTFLHGEAIALGMHAAGWLGKELGLVDDAFVQRQRDCIAAYGLPVQWPELPMDSVVEAMKHDKKARAGQMRFVAPDRMGHVVQRSDVTEDQARRALRALTNGT
ncbi:MAG: 3-dehydroquinate synthase [Candidatus Hydrogenedentota bacterium]